MKAKKPQHNTKEEVKTKNATQWGEYLNTMSMKMEPASDAFFKRLALEIIIWAKEDKKGYRITQFLNIKGIGKGTWYRWIDQYPHIKEAHETALSLLADRREIGALEKKLDSTMVKHTMPMYDKEWKDLEEWRSKISSDLQQTGDIKVIMERFVNLEKP